MQAFLPQTPTRHRRSLPVGVLMRPVPRFHGFAVPPRLSGEKYRLYGLLCFVPEALRATSQRLLRSTCRVVGGWCCGKASPYRRVAAWATFPDLGFLPVWSRGMEPSGPAWTAYPCRNLVHAIAAPLTRSRL